MELGLDRDEKIEGVLDPPVAAGLTLPAASPVRRPPDVDLVGRFIEFNLDDVKVVPGRL